jgi:hypothetical protein
MQRIISATNRITPASYFAENQTAVAPILLKRAVWFYFLLLIFEGALRKWFLPSLATPLLVIRDPVALWIIVMAGRKGFLPFNVFVFAMILVTIISFVMTLIVGHGNLPVAVFGARVLFLQFPLIFAIGKIFTREDVIKIGKVIMYFTPLMTVLIALQFYSPQSAWVNRGLGGDVEGAGFKGGIREFLRPPGTFSFTNGVSLFYGFAAPFIFYFWMKRKHLKMIVLIAATIGLLAAIPLSISRGLMFSVIITFIFMCLASLYQPKFIGALVLTAIGGLLGLVILSNTEFFQTATEAFSTRIELANDTEGGLSGVLGDRYLGGMIGALSYNSVDYPFFGRGIGMGTNVGAQLLEGDRNVFLIAEGEWGRLIGEMGPLLGVLVILIRLTFSGSLAISAFRKLAEGDLLPWLMLSFALLNIPQGQWAQPTSLGFSILCGGLTLASFRKSQHISP